MKIVNRNKAATIKVTVIKTIYTYNHCHLKNILKIPSSIGTKPIREQRMVHSNLIFVRSKTSVK